MEIARSLARAGASVIINGRTSNSVTRACENFPDVDYETAEKRFMSENRSTSLSARLIHPQEIGDFVAFVCSPVAWAIDGACLRVDRGLKLMCS